MGGSWWLLPGQIRPELLPTATCCASVIRTIEKRFNCYRNGGFLSFYARMYCSMIAQIHVYSPGVVALDIRVNFVG